MISDILSELMHLIPEIAFDVTVALLPIIIIFAVFQLTLLKLPKSALVSMAAGMVYAFLGLLLFFLGVEIGFTETGEFLGNALGQLDYNWVLIPIGLLIGFSVVLAEPAVRTLVHQVETVSGGMIRKAAIYGSLCIGVATSVSLAMFRAIFNISFWYFIIPGYIIALVLVKFSPRLFTSIAFDAGGVATGPMTSTFVMAFTIGVASIVHPDNTVADAFGVVAFVAMTPLITIQILGIIYQRKARMAENALKSSESELGSKDNVSQGTVKAGIEQDSLDDIIVDYVSEVDDTSKK